MERKNVNTSRGPSIEVLTGKTLGAKVQNRSTFGSQIKGKTVNQTSSSTNRVESPVNRTAGPFYPSSN
jgi:hypothetical protein